MREKIAGGLIIAAALLLSYNFYHIFKVLPDDALQGPIYRILFIHVPAAITGMIGYFVALGLSISYLMTRNFRYDSLAASVVEVSVIFSLVNIVTGSIWARVIWGIWWTWDARLTSALVCVLIFAAYVMMRRAIDEPTQRARLSAALCIFGCVDVVIVWKSIDWFRTQHPSPVLSIRTGGGHMDPAMEHMFYWMLLAILMIASALVLIRTRQETMAREIDSLRRFANAAA
ncbi:MAG TPA: cytochrome c biogenesis protein CcsA [Bryobacteraceae bacterium]|jgi:heme exporter protein C|nr:cytochrome c biogenesis protein CcsA [Bryobacteraceae bacterium]